MSINIISVNQDPHPGFNEHWIISDSTNKNDAEFRYVYDIWSGNTYQQFQGRYLVPPRPGDGYGQLNIQKIVATQLSPLMSADTVGFLAMSGHFHTYRVSIGETTPYWSFGDNNNSCFPKVAFSGTNDHGLTAGEEIIIQQDNGYVNESYQGFTIVDSLPADNIVCTEKLWDENTPLNPGRIYRANGAGFITTAITANTGTAFIGVVGRNEFPDFNYQDYNFLSSAAKFFSNVPSTFTMHRDSRAIITYYNFSNFFTRLRVKTYQQDGSLYGEYTVDSPFDYIGSKPDEDLVIGVGVGPWNLQNLPGASYTVVSGPSGIIDSNVASYTYWMEKSSSLTGETKTVNIQESGCPYPNFQLMFLDKMGSWMPFNFCGRHTEKHKINRKTYKKPVHVFGNTVTRQNSYNLSDRGYAVYTTDISKEYEINTGFLNDAESEYFMELLQSPEVYHIDETYGALPVILNSGNYERQQEINDLISYKVKFQYAYNEPTQQF